MFLLNWYQEYLELKNNYRAKTRELEYCESCETLKLQLSLANESQTRLLDRILEKPAEIKEVENTAFKPILPNRMSWSVRQQMLEAEDRMKARALRDNDAIKQDHPVRQYDPSKALAISELEKELGVEEVG